MLTVPARGFDSPRLHSHVSVAPRCQPHSRLGRYGGRSAIDGVILRDKDANTAWTAASDGTLEERIYYCHNWRGDISVLIVDDADMVEWIKYSAYGKPFGLPKGDVDSDGDLDSTDVTAIQTWGANPYDVRADLDLSGTISPGDGTAASNASPITLGWGNLSNVGNRKGYAGYEFDDVLAGSASIHHVRNRVLHAELGRWTRRDPLRYIDGANLYEYGGSTPVVTVDPRGEWLLPAIAIVGLIGAAVVCLINLNDCLDAVDTAKSDCLSQCELHFPYYPEDVDASEDFHNCVGCCHSKANDDSSQCSPCGLQGPGNDYCQCYGCGDDPPVWWRPGLPWPPG